MTHRITQIYHSEGDRLAQAFVVAYIATFAYALGEFILYHLIKLYTQ